MSKRKTKFVPPVPGDQDPEKVRQLIALLNDPEVITAGGIQPQTAMEAFGWNYQTWGWTVHAVRQQYGPHALVSERRGAGPGWYRWAADLPDGKAYIDRRKLDIHRRTANTARLLNLVEADFGADKEARAVRILLQAVSELLEPTA